MLEQLSISNWLTKNPLGIVALFISLIYGMCSLLLGITLERLTAVNETILISFIAVFPFVVLAAFLWLVIVHPNRLYGPSDFRTDESFLALQMATPASLGNRLLKETGSQATPASPYAANPAESGQKIVAKAEPNSVKSDAIRTSPLNVSPLVSETYLIEGLAFQQLQSEFGAPILREVEIELTDSQKVRVDGLLQTPSATIGIEVFLVRDTSAAVLDRAHELCNSFISAVKGGAKAKKPYRLVEVFVLSGSESESTREAVMNFAYKASYPVDVRVLTAKTLIQKFGIPISA